MAVDTPAARRRRRRHRVTEAVTRDAVYGVTTRVLGDGRVELTWRSHADSLVALAQVRGIDEAVEAVVVALIARNRAAGLSWDDIAGVLGYSRPAVIKRWGPLVEEFERLAPSS